MKPEKALLIAAVLADFCYSIASLTIPMVLVRELRLGTLECGWIAAAASLPYTIACFGFGKLVHREEHRKFWSLLGVAWLAVGLAGLAFVHSYRGFFLWAATAPALGLFWPIAQAWTGGRRSPQETSRRLRYFNVAWTVGMMIGFAAAGAIYRYGSQWSFLSAAAVAALLGLLIASVEAPPPAPAGAVSPAAGHGPDLVRLAYVCNFTAYFGLGIVRSIYPDLGHYLGFSARLVGILEATLMAVQAAAFLLMTRSAWMYSRAVLFGGLAAGLVGLACLFVSGLAPVHFAGMALLGVMGAVVYKFSLYHSIVRPVGRKTLTGNHEGILSAGSLAGFILGGYAGHVTGNHFAPYMLAAAALAAVMAGYVIAWRRSTSFSLRAN